MYANLALPALLAERGITGRDAAFHRTHLRHLPPPAACFDVVIAAAAGRPRDQIDPVLLDLLRLGAYQRLLRTNVAEHAAVSTTRRTGGLEFDSARAGFVNAVLRKISAATNRPGWPNWRRWLTRTRSAMRPWCTPTRVGSPPGLRRLTGRRGRELDAALAADDARPAVHLAAPPGVLSAAALAEPSTARSGRYSPYAVYLAAATRRLEPIRDGAALVQDEGSQLVARRSPRRRWSVPTVPTGHDLCAGPGGKTATWPASAPRRAPRHRAVETQMPARRPGEQNAPPGLPVDVVGPTAAKRDCSRVSTVSWSTPLHGASALRRRPEARWRPAVPIAPLTAPTRTAGRRDRLTRPAAWCCLRDLFAASAETVGVVLAADARRHPVTALDTAVVRARPVASAPGRTSSCSRTAQGTDAMFCRRALRKN